MFDSLKLYSKKPAEIFNFLSFIFDIEILENSETNIRFRLGGVIFEIIECKKSKISKEHFFTLCVDQVIKLQELKQSLEFYEYKQNMKELKSTINGSELSFIDPDGRSWQVLVKNEFSFKDAMHPNKAINVRNC